MQNETTRQTYNPTTFKLLHIYHHDNKYLLTWVSSDRGTQPRHGIYYHTRKQREMHEKYWIPCKTELEQAAVVPRSIVSKSVEGRSVGMLRISDRSNEAIVMNFSSDGNSITCT